MELWNEWAEKKEADSLDDAVKIVEEHPHFHTPDGTIDVLEFLEMPGMEG